MDVKLEDIDSYLKKSQDGRGHYLLDTMKNNAVAQVKLTLDGVIRWIQAAMSHVFLLDKQYGKPNAAIKATPLCKPPPSEYAKNWADHKTRLTRWFVYALLRAVAYQSSCSTLFSLCISRSARKRFLPPLRQVMHCMSLEHDATLRGTTSMARTPEGAHFFRLPNLSQWNEVSMSQESHYFGKWDHHDTHRM